MIDSTNSSHKKPISKLPDLAKQPRIEWAGLTILIVLVAFILFWVDPARPGILPPCPFRLFTGLKCPGCGTLRGLHQLLHGHPLEAWRFNPLMVITLPLMTYIWISYTSKVFRGKPLLNLNLRAYWIWLLLVFILLYWVGRNIF